MSIITGNSATWGGGILSWADSRKPGSATVTIDGSIIRNKADSHGRGIWSNVDMNLRGGSIVWNSPDDLYDDRYAL